MKLKKLLAILLSAVFMIAGLPQIVSADEGDTGIYEDFEYTEIEDGTLSITNYIGADEEVVIPSEINGKTVSTIARNAIPYYITSVIIPDSIILLQGAFDVATSLVSIDVSKDNEFYVSVDGVLFDKNVSTLLRYPPCKENIKYVVPDSVTSIGQSAFHASSLLQTVTLPENLKDIERYAFHYAHSLESVNIPYGITSISFSAFMQCHSLKAISLPDTVTLIDNWAFYECESLEKIIIPASVIEINPYSTFEYCSNDLTIYGYKSSYAETYAAEHDINFVALTVSLADNEIEIEGALPHDTVLSAEKIKETEDSITYDITLIDTNGEALQPDTEVTVKIPVPTDWETDSLKVYRAEPDNTYTNMNAKYSDNCMVFTTDHFSTYILTTKTLTKITITGDVNNSGEVNDLDVVDLARYLAGWNVTIDLAAADVDGSGKVDDLDVVTLARRLAGWNV